MKTTKTTKTTKKPTKATLTKLRTKLKAITAAYHSKYCAVDTPVKLSSTAKRVIKAMKGAGFGCQTESVCKVLGALLGEPILKYLRKPKMPYAKGLVIVLRANSNSHNYPLHTPVICTSDEKAFRPKNGRGNYLPTYNNLKEVRCATPEEIDKLSDAYLIAYLTSRKTW